MDDLNITAAQYLVNVDGDNDTIRVTVDGTEMNVPVYPGNRHYDEIMRQVAAGTLTIADAD
jgi:hypothetical protein